MDRVLSPEGIARRIGMSSPDIGAREIERVLEVLRSHVLSIGPVVEEFEELTAAYVGARHAVAVNSGTAGLHECVVAAGIGPGDEVITTPYSFITSANVALFEKAVPVFVDIDPLTYNVDPALIEERIGPRTRAILPVHVFGQPADMDPILDVAQRHRLPVIEDACEAIGAEYKGRRVGTLGHAGVLAFYPNKQMTTGEGGVIVTNRDDWAAIFRSIRNQGRDEMDGWLMHSRLGYNHRMSELSAALGAVQIRRIDELLSNREQVAAKYTAALAGVPGVRTPVIAPTTTRMSWFVYVIEVDASIDRDRLVRRLEAEGIPTRPYFPAIHLQPFYRAQFGYAEGAFPVAERVARRTLALPFHGQLAEADLAYICERLAALVR